MPNGGTEWYKGLKERGLEGMAWLQPELTRKQYEEGLEIYLARMVEAGSFSEDYADELEVWAKQQAAAEGIHTDLLFYSNIAQRHITPQWWQEQYERYTEPAYQEQARIGQWQADIANEQRRLMEQQGMPGWQPGYQMPTWQPGQALPQAGTLYQHPGEEQVYRAIPTQPQLQRGAGGLPPLSVGGLERGREEEVWRAAQLKGMGLAATQQREVEAMNEALFLAKEWPEWWGRFEEERFRSGDVTPPQYQFKNWLGSQPEFKKAQLQREKTGYLEYPYLYPQYQQYVEQEGLAKTTKGFEKWAETTPWASAYLESKIGEGARMAKPPRWAVPTQRAGRGI